MRDFTFMIDAVLQFVIFVIGVEVEVVVCTILHASMFHFSGTMKCYRCSSSLKFSGFQIHWRKIGAG